MELRQSQTTLTAILEGELDHHSAKAARERIDAAVEKNHIQLLQLDFSGVSFMDSSGIGLILGRYRLMQSVGGALEVVHTPPQLEKLMRLAGLSQLDVIRQSAENKGGNLHDTADQ